MYRKQPGQMSWYLIKHIIMIPSMFGHCQFTTHSHMLKRVVIVYSCVQFAYPGIFFLNFFIYTHLHNTLPNVPFSETDLSPESTSLYNLYTSCRNTGSCHIEVLIFPLIPVDNESGIISNEQNAEYLLK